MEGYIKISQASKFLDIPAQTLRRMEKRNEVTAYRDKDNNRIFKITELEAYLRDQGTPRKFEEEKRDTQVRERMMNTIIFMATKNFDWRSMEAFKKVCEQVIYHHAKTDTRYEGFMINYEDLLK